MTTTYYVNHSNRKADVCLDKRVEFLLNSLYKYSGISYYRPSDVWLDIHGVDVIFEDSKLNPMFVDEKCATKYWDRDLNTFSCELSCSRNKNSDGWFSSKGNTFFKTTHYLFFWVRALEPELKRISSAEIMIVDKKALQKYFLNIAHCATTETIVKDAKSFGRPIYYADGIKVKVCNIYPEYPVNVIFDKDILARFAISHKTFTRHEVRDAIVAEKYRVHTNSHAIG